MTIRELIVQLIKDYDDLDYEVLVSVDGQEYPDGLRLRNSVETNAGLNYLWNRPKKSVGSTLQDKLRSKA